MQWKTIKLLLQNKRIPTTCDNMDGSGGYYAKRNKSITER